MLPLGDIRILDLTRLAPGPFCTMVLGDLGANVLRVEEPAGGRRATLERARNQLDPEEEQYKARHNILNRNKRSICLNLKNPEAQMAFYALVKDADVIVEGFRPGVVQRLNVDYKTLKEQNPRLIYCSITGYGQNGPYANLVGHDINYISTGGALGVIGSKDGPPVIPYNIIADYAAGGMQAAVAILAALMSRARTGRGQYLDIAMTDGVLYLLAAMASEYLSQGILPERGAMRLNGGMPYYNVYQAKDGKYLSIGCVEPWFYHNLCQALGREDLAAFQHDTGKKREETFNYFRKVFKSRTRDDWFEELKEKDIAVAKVYSLDEVFDDPQLKYRGMIMDPHGVTSENILQVGIAPQLSDTPGMIRTLGPTLGEHTDEILADLGYSSEDISRLRGEHAI